MIDGKRLVHLRKQHRVVTGIVAELLQGIVLQHVDGAALLIDPHRVGAGVAEYPEQLGNVGWQRSGLVRGPGNECLATGRERPQQQHRSDDPPAARRGVEFIVGYSCASPGPHVVARISARAPVTVPPDNLTLSPARGELQFRLVGGIMRDFVGVVRRIDSPCRLG